MSNKTPAPIILFCLVFNAGPLAAAPVTESSAYAEFDRQGLPQPDYSEYDWQTLDGATSAVADTTRSHSLVSTNYGEHHIYVEAATFLDQYSAFARGYSRTWDDFFWAGPADGIGTMEITYTINGTLLALSTSASGAYYSFDVTFDPNDDLSGSFPHPLDLINLYDEVACGDPIKFCGSKNINQDVTVSFEFPYNTTFTLESILDAVAWSSDDIDNSGFAMADFQDTIAMTGILIDGTPVSITGAGGVTYPLAYTPPVPLPAAFWLFGSGLLGLVGITRRQKPEKT